MILRATQFFERSSQIVEAGGEGDRVRLSTRLMQLVAVDEMAATVTGLATARRSAAASRSVGPRRWASTRGGGGCSPPPETSAR